MPRRQGPTIQRKVNLSPELDNKVSLMLADPGRQKLKYGAFSELVEACLWMYIKRLESAAKDI